MNADIIYGHHFHSSLARIFWQAHNQRAPTPSHIWRARFLATLSTHQLNGGIKKQ